MRLDPHKDPRSRADLPDGDLRELGRVMPMPFGGPRPRVACATCWRELHE